MPGYDGRNNTSKNIVGELNIYAVLGGKFCEAHKLSLLTTFVGRRQMVVALYFANLIGKRKALAQ